MFLLAVLAKKIWCMVGMHGPVAMGLGSETPLKLTAYVMYHCTSICNNKHGTKKLGEALIVITSIRTVLTNQKRIYIAITLNTLESGAD